MAGHSEWANRVHRKRRQDKKRAKLFSKIARQIIVAAREGGGDPDKNVKLKWAIEEARDADMPKDNIEYAIKRGTGDLEGVEYESMTLEAYGPGGVAIVISCVSDNRQRTIAELRHILDGRDSDLAEPGAVTWMFDRKGVITVPRDDTEEEDVFMTAVDAGAEDVILDNEQYYEVRTPVAEFHTVLDRLDEQEIPHERAELTMIPKTTIPVQDGDSKALLGLLDELDDHDDVQQVFANFEISDEAMVTYDAA